MVKCPVYPLRCFLYVDYPSVYLSSIYLSIYLPVYLHPHSFTEERINLEMFWVFQEECHPGILLNVHLSTLGLSLNNSNERNPVQ